MVPLVLKWFFWTHWRNMPSWFLLQMYLAKAYCLPKISNPFKRLSPVSNGSFQMCLCLSLVRTLLQLKVLQSLLLVSWNTLYYNDCMANLNHTTKQIVFITSSTNLCNKGHTETKCVRNRVATIRLHAEHIHRIPFFVNNRKIIFRMWLTLRLHV